MNICDKNSNFSHVSIRFSVFSPLLSIIPIFAPTKSLIMSASFENQEEQIFSERTEKETDKKCPNCGATVVFDPATGGLHCEYCGYTCELPKAETESDICEMDFESAIHTESFDWGDQKKEVQCKQCGAVTIYDALETAAVCPFCGSTSVMPAATENTISPGAICPFVITKDQVGDCFTKWLNKKWFAPSKAKKNARPEAFQGVYLPYWTYDAQTTSNFTARAGYDKIVKDRDGKTRTETHWKHVNGMFQEFFNDVTVMASKRQEDSGVKECEPFDFSKLVPYSPKIVAGFVAERYSIGLKDGWESAQKNIQSRLRSDIGDHVRRHWRANRSDSVRFSTLYSNITYKYILVPTWISSFKYKDKVYQFAVNGQTGKVGGKAPVSAWRVLLAVLIGAAVMLALYYYS
jgi:ribosomal protein S27E